MTKHWLALMSILGILGCGSGEAVSQDPEVEVRETMERMRAGETIDETATGLDPCAMLESGLVVEVFEADPQTVTYRAGSTSHPLCTAMWDKPDKAELEAKQSEVMMDHMQRRVAAMSKGEPFDEPMPILRTTNEVTLTINDSTFDSPEAAVAALEGIVERLSEGMTVEALGKEHSVSVAYEGLAQEAGERSAWAPKLSQLSVAAEGVIYHVGVRVFDDPEENRAKAVEVANRVAEAL